MENLKARLTEMHDYLHLSEVEEKERALEATSSQPGFWDDQASASKTMEELNAAQELLGDFADAQKLLDDAQAAQELFAETNDAAFEEEANKLAELLSKKLDTLEMSSWFTGEFDRSNAIVTVTPGQGGLEAQDWVEMLFRMYTRFAERHAWKVEVLDAPVAEGIGLDRATFKVSGRNAYGMLQGEQGVHRMVRISPTDAKKRRHTTFAGVEVLPVLPDSIEVEINSADLRVDVYRSSGPGGQGVNTTDSAVRLTHLPTGIVVTCQNERSQLQNKAVAMEILRSKLYEFERAKRAEELDELRGPKKEISFGSQIRNYVFYPYQLVKDTRTGEETSRIDEVLDGDLDAFVLNYLRWKTANAASV